jgi:precorrin-8X/cobalt-precorrin-8 methylmutase
VFDRFVAVDWSASSTPKRGRDSIWIAIDDATGYRSENPSTRQAAERFLHDLLDGDDAPTLVAIDISLGYPAGTAAALGLPGRPWAATAGLLADLTVDEPDNTNNRFEVAADLNRRMSGTAAPFWGCPPHRATAMLTATKPPPTPGVRQWREVEQCLRNAGHRPFDAWQLLGAGAVGSQSLLGIPAVRRLADHVGDRVHVWPFTSGLRAPVVERGTVVVAEVWPSLLPVVVGPGDVRDAAQVAAVVAWLGALDAAGELEELFVPEVPATVRSIVEDEEGWVLGVTG